MSMHQINNGKHSGLSTPLFKFKTIIGRNVELSEQIKFSFVVDIIICKASSFDKKAQYARVLKLKTLKSENS